MLGPYWRKDTVFITIPEDKTDECVFSHIGPVVSDFYGDIALLSGPQESLKKTTSI
jgi:hypothetical protein